MINSEMGRKRAAPQTDAEHQLKYQLLDDEDDVNSTQESLLSNGFDTDRSCQWMPSVEEVARFLEENELSDVADKFRDEEISGHGIQYITEESLKQIGIEPLGTRLRVLDLLQQLRSRFTVSMEKVFNDPIHGHIELHPLCVKIIDTPQFQRLRFIKQLGACYFVFPGAAHNRFEHSIGVCHLAGKLARTLQNRQPELGITEVDVLCVEIAGLCHDLGHGPFSHMFDGKFLPVARPDRSWEHEQGSIMMFDHLLKENNLMEEFQKYGLDENDCLFIKEQIRGPLNKDKVEGQIVANKRNSIDVDKWDYFARDCHMLGIKNNFDHSRYMKFARVLDVNGQLQICSRDKEVGNLYDMFHTRNTLHRRAYQHTVNTMIETMITEAFLKADDHLTVQGSNGTTEGILMKLGRVKKELTVPYRKMLKMSECVDDPVAFEKLTDCVFYQILWSTDPKLEEARSILQNIMKRQLYRFVGQATPPDGKIYNRKNDIHSIKQEVSDKIHSESITSQDLVVHIAYLDYGMKDKNPIDHVRFYNKKNPSMAIQLRKNQVSKMLPEKFAEQYVRLYSKKRDEESVQLITEGFHAWCEENELKTTNASNMTPVKSDTSGSDASPDLQSTPDQSTRPKQATPSTAGKFKSRLKFD